MVLDDVDALGAARRDVLDTLGAEALVDACGVAATFNAIDRVADSTGIPIDEARLEPTADFRESLGINAFPSGKSPADRGRNIFYGPVTFLSANWRVGYGQTLTRYYDEMTESVSLADELGWTRALTTEHHFHYYGGAVPNPAIILAAWAREAQNIRLAPAVSLMQLRDPLKVAEDYALVDHLSGGRCDMGVAKGFVPHEFDAFDIDQSEVPDRIAEGLEICQKFWAGEPFEHSGKHFSFEKLEPWPPAVNGSLPIWNAASNSMKASSTLLNAATTL